MQLYNPVTMEQAIIISNILSSVHLYAICISVIVGRLKRHDVCVGLFYIEMLGVIETV